MADFGDRHSDSAHFFEYAPEVERKLVGINIVKVDLTRSDHAEAFLTMMNAYACDPMGDGKPLTDDVLERLVPALKAHPTTCIFLAMAGDKPVGLVVCFRGFSTFAARPLLNISDFYVAEEVRGQGIGRVLLDRVEQEARATDCCKITLEVQENNQRAQRIYAAFGFASVIYVEEAGAVRFLSKQLGG